LVVIIIIIIIISSSSSSSSNIIIIIIIIIVIMLYSFIFQNVWGHFCGERIAGLGFGVWGLGFGVWGLGFGVSRAFMVLQGVESALFMTKGLEFIE